MVRGPCSSSKWLAARAGGHGPWVNLERLVAPKRMVTEVSRDWSPKEEIEERIKLSTQ